MGTKVSKSQEESMKITILELECVLSLILTLFDHGFSPFSWHVACFGENLQTLKSNIVFKQEKTLEKQNRRENA